MGHIVSDSTATDFDQILNRISALVGEDLGYLTTRGLIWTQGQTRRFLQYDEFRPKLSQARYMLEMGYNINDKIVEIGSLYNSIKDAELRERCGDLLTAPAHFDRVVNQATQVLEHRIRLKSGLDKAVIGTDLVNKAINSDPRKSIIVISEMGSEQEGFANICRGLMQALRNESHHAISEDFSREDAFAICGFIDRILRVIDRSVVRK